MKRLFALMLVLSVAVVFSACAQLNANVSDIHAAQDIINDAWVAGASTEAAYEYNSAKAYLEAAEHERDENDYDAARKYAAKALEQAKKALEKSK